MRLVTGGLLRKLPTGYQLKVYFCGCLSFSLGAAAFIASHLGTDPLDVFALGLKRHMPITVGIAQAGFAALCLLIWASWNKRLPILSPFFTFLFCGSLIDLWMYLEIGRLSHLPPLQLLLIGAALCAYGSSLIIMSGFGIRAMDLLAITMTYKWKTPFWLNKGQLESALLISGWLLGGPVGVGTIVFLCVVGWCIQPLIVLNTSLFSLRNLGFGTVSEYSVSHI